MSADVADKGGIEIIPVRVVAFDEIDLSFALVLLEGLFPLDRRDNGFVLFEPDQPVHCIGLCEPRDQALTMISRSARQLAGHADVERSVSSTCHHVDGNEAIECIA
jgi:hypothetical protein